MPLYKLKPEGYTESQVLITSLEFGPFPEKFYRGVPQDWYYIGRPSTQQLYTTYVFYNHQIQKGNDERNRTRGKIQSDYFLFVN